ncbi:MAG: LacI family transcriptional regulator [Oscillospiraceae bacterium]|nr:LacI family transcriptional regulator [Oscillospiraceae bacterium]
MASLTDVAKRAGVSKTLVSRVINNQTGVGKESRKRILAAMKEFSYTPNALARSLVLQKTQTIGVVLDTLCEPYFFQLIRGIEDQIAKSSYDVIFCSGHNDYNQKNRYIRFFSQGRVDGVLLYGSNLNDIEVIEQLCWSKFPFVVIENYSEEMDINNIVVDNAYGSKLAIDHLYECGCRRICHVTGDLKVKASLDRRDGYLKALQKKGIPLSEAMVLEADFSTQSGYDAISAFLSDCDGDAMPDAFYFGSDVTAFGGMKALEENGYRIPGDVMAVGFDDDRPPPNFDYAITPLTTISQPLYDMGMSAVDMLLAEIDGAVSQKQKRIFYPSLIVRNTTVIKNKQR